MQESTAGRTSVSSSYSGSLCRLNIIQAVCATVFLADGIEFWKVMLEKQLDRSTSRYTSAFLRNFAVFTNNSNMNKAALLYLLA
jgi:hypothetical protein